MDIDYVSLTLSLFALVLLALDKIRRSKCCGCVDVETRTPLLPKQPLVLPTQ